MAYGSHRGSGKKKGTCRFGRSKVGRRNAKGLRRCLKNKRSARITKAMWDQAPAPRSALSRYRRRRR